MLVQQRIFKAIQSCFNMAKQSASYSIERSQIWAGVLESASGDVFRRGQIVRYKPFAYSAAWHAAYHGSP
jgi:hypothetical protein